MRPNSPGLRAAFRSLKRRPGKRRGRNESRSEAIFPAMRSRVVIDCLVVLDWFAFGKRVYLRWSVGRRIRLPDRSCLLSRLGRCLPSPKGSGAVLQISPYPLRSGARFHLRAHLSVKGEVGIGLPTLKKPFSGRFSTHLLLKSRFPDPFSFIDAGGRRQILRAQRPLLLKEPVFDRVFLHLRKRRTVDGRSADGRRTVSDRPSAT